MKKLLTGLMPDRPAPLLTWLLLISFSFSSHAQTFPVKGTVTGKPDNLPLAGVTVSIKGSAKATQTNTEGKFEISASSKDILQFSFIGFTTQELPATASPVQISLEQAKGALNEVVVTALGIARQKKSLGYAVQELKAKDISSIPSRVK
jgi:hypothetical protein